LSLNPIKKEYYTSQGGKKTRQGRKEDQYPKKGFLVLKRIQKWNKKSLT